MTSTPNPSAPGTGPSPSGPSQTGSGVDRADPVTNWFGRNGWVVAAVWLIFLAFPALTVLGQDDISGPRKAVSLALMVVFAAVYSHGFRCQEVAIRHAGDPANQPPKIFAAGRAHLGTLIALTLVVFAVVDLPALGLVPFVVTFAVFFLPWPWVMVCFATGLATSVVVPFAMDALDDLWLISLIVVGTGGGAMLIRVVDASVAAQAELRTDLVISDERNRMARDVHDVLGHSLTAIILKVELTKRLLDGVESSDTEHGERLESSRAQLSELESISRSALAEIRSTVGGLRTVELGSEITMARTVLADAGVDLLVTGNVSAVSETKRQVLAWVLREAVTNIVRHAEATTCHIELAPGPEQVLLRITDDGVGMAGQGEGNGLRGLRERVAAGGAELHVGRVEPGSDQQGGAGDPGRPGTRIEVTT